ncbi:MAG: prenyltransferase/squalene oxidase repeat-containing protein [Thermodesulfovibrio sp.]|nr:prenyltransferase/squalene oxidase repeat-containing protein [Thermodesulfovibrio sp.]
MNLRKNLDNCYNFVIKRKRQEGGFAATPLLPPTIEDTYHALKIIKDLREFGLYIDYSPQEDETLKIWLYQNKTTLREPKNFYQFLRVCLMCNFEIESLKQYTNLLFSGIITLERIFYLVKISELFNLSLPEINKLPFSKVVKDLWMTIYLSDKGITREKIDKKRLIKYLRECQNPDGGFGFLPKTTSYIDNTYFCLKALNFLHSGPKDRESALNFILFSQTKSGGFGRVPKTASLLDSTFYAVESLRILLLK